MTSFRTLARSSSTVALVRGAVFSALAASGCHVEVENCSNTPRPEDGLYPCDNAYIRREQPPACIDGRPHYGGSCATDEDCPGGRVCYCGPLALSDYGGTEEFPIPTDEGTGRCVYATCRTSADCGEGNHCVALETFVCQPELQFACTTGADECVGSDCICYNDTNDERLLCAAEEGCGRPFLVDGVARIAAVTERSDWRAGDAIDDLDASNREELAAFWLRTAQLEHASVAAFARFTLELLALGAPSDLVAGASKAMADEIRHAELAFDLASRHAGRSFGPAALPIAGALAAIDVADVVERLVIEGCWGETMAACLARESAAIVRGRDAAVLSQIAVEETEHAALAWRVLGWLATSRPTETRLGITQAATKIGQGDLDGALLHRDAARVLRAEVLATVVSPALRAVAA